VATQTVPDIMLGCWRRAWIEFGDGRRDATGVVLWLQTESAMADVRVSADRGDFTGCASLQECSIDQLRAIAGSDGSSGWTECTAVVEDADGTRTATAEWHTRGHGINFQPVSAYPEPGLMTWNSDATVMHERAPSGAYVEEWRLVPDSRRPLSFATSGAVNVYRAGPTAVAVRDRVQPAPRLARLPELVDELADDRATLEGLLNCEFSIAEQRDGKWTITTSTLPWLERTRLEGTHPDVDLR
jgi:hypothetical protein